MRRQRICASMIECSNMCPMCRAPVTFGGGITSEKYGWPGRASAWNRLCDTHHSAQCGSKRWGSYTLSSCVSMGKLQFYRARDSFGLLKKHVQRKGRQTCDPEIEPGEQSRDDLRRDSAFIAWK